MAVAGFMLMASGLTNLKPMRYGLTNRAQA
jgi:hypothetical protein